MLGSYFGRRLVSKMNECFQLEERRELFILKGKSNHSDLSRKFRHRSLKLSAQRKNTVHADSPLGLLAIVRTPDGRWDS